MLNFNNIFKEFTPNIGEKSLESYNNEESLEDNSIEQNSIIYSDENSNEFSFEDDESSFEDAADESSNNKKSNTDEGGSDEDDFDSEMDEIDSMDEEGGEGDGDSGDDDFSDDSEDSSSDDGDDSSDGLDSLDKNKGSSLNPYTQINQKNFFIDKLNELYDSITSTVDKCNTLYSDWYEINQLRDLANIVDDERNAFMMQQNPENFIKLRLYCDRYEEIVQKFVERKNKQNSD